MKKVFRKKTVRWVALVGLFSFFCGCSLTKSDEEKAEKFFQSGMKDLESHEYKSAILDFKNAVQKNPNLAKAYFQMGLAYVDSGKILLGFIEMRTAVRLAPENESFLNTYANLLLDHQYYKDAVKYLNPLLKRRPNDPGLQLKLANAQLKAKQFEPAADTFRQIIERKPNDVAAKIGLADALYGQNKFYEAQEILKETVSSAGNSVPARIALARFYEKRGRLDQAIGLFAKISHEFSNDPEAQLAYAQYLIRREKTATAGKVVDEATKRGLEAPMLLYIKAYLADKEGREDVALKILEKAVQLFPNDPRSWKFLGDQYVRISQYAKAREAYLKALSKGGEKADQRLDVAFTYDREGEYEKAASEVLRVLDAYPNNSRAHYLHGKLLLRQGKKEPAKEAFRLAKAYDAENSGAYYYCGLGLFEEGLYERAKMEVTTALSLRPDFTSARMLMGRIYFHLDENENALKAVNRVLAVRPDDPDARKLRGDIYVRMKNYRAALRDYGFLESLDPENPNIQFRMAALYQAGGQDEKALAKFEKLSKTYPDKSELLKRITQIYMDMKNCHKAIDICRKYRVENPDSLGIGILNSQVLIKCGEEDQAGKLLERLAKAHPNSDKPYLMLGKLAIDSEKDPSSAIQYFQRAVDGNPQSVSAHLGLADVYERVGRDDLAEKNYQEALEIEPDNVFALNNLAFLYARSDENLDKALSLARRARKLAPNDSDVLDTLAFIHLKKGAFLLAQKSLLEAYDKDPENGSVNYTLGIYEFRHNNFLEAKEYFDQALKFGVDALTPKEIMAYKNRIKKIEEDMNTAGTSVAKGEIENAITLYEEILRKTGFYAPAAARLAAIYAEAGQKVDRAFDLAEKAKKKLPADPYLLDTLGLIYFKKGSFLMAKRYFDEAIIISPETARFHYHLGLVYLRENDSKTAAHALQQSIKLGLSGKSLDSARRLLKEIS